MRSTVQTPEIADSGTGEWRIAKQSPVGDFMQLFPVLQRARGGESASGIFAFCSATSGEGVTYVTEALGKELALLPCEEVLVTSASVLATLSPEDLGESSTALLEIAPGLWAARTLAGRSASPTLSLELIDALRSRFTFVLIDCRCLQKSPEALRLAPRVDGMLLIVAAGQSRREQVLRAQAVLQLPADNLLGLILNKRTYPVPQAIHRLL